MERKVKKSQTDLDRIEVSDNLFYQKVRDGYLNLAKKEKRFRVIDGTLSIEKIHELIINEIKTLEGVK